jgi:hypothetical protein
MQQVNISSTTIPAGASHFLVYSGNANGEMASPLSAPIRDMYAWNLRNRSKSREIPPFTSIRHIFTFSTGEILTFETSLANQVLPSPLSLSFTDSSSTTHFVSGLLQLGEPSDVSDILRSLTCELSEL